MRHDYAIVGGGLQAGLVALAVRTRQPDARIAIVERATSLGGNHTWCFHAGDVPAESAWIEPLVVARWDGYDVAFPGRRRTLASAYACVSSDRLAACATAAADTVWLGEPATEIAEHRIATATRALEATVVIDARGPDRADSERAGWQNFVGQEVIVPAHGLVRPIVMDATVEQRGAFRFMYVLPLALDRLLIEDTAFADSPYLDVAAGRGAIAAYARARGWQLGEILREETGVLPLPLALAPPAPVRSPLVAGYAGGWFHPTTGYSFPIAARLADFIARRSPSELFGADLDAHAADHATQLAFALRLNRMLFGWFAPERRYGVLERFYGLPEPVIRRFYALAMSRLDRARLLVGRPPRGMSWRAALGGAR
ncbi:MAG: lycopene beta-cyclase CrtY [Kofleriaceae bacterium]